jgi:ACT domain-containing protein
MAVIQLRHQLTTKTGYAATLELVLKQRTETIDQLNARLEQSGAQCRRLDEENERLVEMVRLPPDGLV